LSCADVQEERLSIIVQGDTMLCFRASVVACALASFLVPGILRADEKPSTDRPTREGKLVIRERNENAVGLLRKVRHLMPPEYVDALNLNDQQRKSVRELDDQFKKKRLTILLDGVTKVQKILQGAQDGDETAPVLAIMHAVTGNLLEVRHVRMDLRKKMLAELTEDQRDQYFELLQQRPRERKVYRVRFEEERKEGKKPVKE
jgi:hypothetical protein